MNNQEILLGRIDFDYAPLKAPGEIKESGARMEALVDHFKIRKTPVYLFTKEEAAKLKDDKIISDAEAVMNHFIYGYQFTGDIDWFFNPTTETSRDNEWSWSLYRTIYWQPLARAYALTGDEKYAAEFVRQLKSFTAAWPAPPSYDDSIYEAKFKFPGHAWRTIETAIRIYTTWLPCFIIFRDSPSWDSEGWAAFLNCVYDSAEFLFLHYTNHERSSNWLTMEATGLFQAGIMFPEFKNAEKWRRTAYQRVMQEIKYSFDNDGIHMERTPIYHLVAAISFQQAFELCKLNGIPVPPYAEATLIKSAEFLGALVKPDFSTPMIGDADRNSLTDRRSDESVYEGMNLSFNPSDLNEIRCFFRYFADLTGRDDFRWFCSGGKEGHAPKKRSFAMKEAGFYVMRTGWSPEDSYFLVHGVQLERGEKSTHSHNDTGHLELVIGGEDILIDSGRFIYNSSCWKDWRHYFTSAKAHNTLYIDDHTMGTVPKVTRTRGVRTFCHAFEENRDYSLIDISHNGYAFMEDPVFHRRRVIRLQGDIFIVDDQLSGPGYGEHDFALYFNFAPGELFSINSGHYKYVSAAGGAYFYSGFCGRAAEFSVLKGSEDPIGGWVSYGYPVRKPIPQLCFSSRGPVPLRFVSVICPRESGVKAEFAENSVNLLFSKPYNILVELRYDNINIIRD